MEGKGGCTERAEMEEKKGETKVRTHLRRTKTRWEEQTELKRETTI